MSIFLPEGSTFTDSDTPSSYSEAELKNAKLEKTILEARAVMCDSEHNLHVDLGSIRGVIPRELGALGIAEGKVRDIALISRVNKVVCFTVEGFDEAVDGKKIAILSRRNAQEICKNKFIENLVCGDIIDAKITHLEKFGAFCDIGCGIVALMPIDAISVSRISHPSDRFCVGDKISAVVRSIDENHRITLSLKELLGTWQENADLFNVGQTVRGVVRSVEHYGIFVELTPNLAGLAEPMEGIFVGQEVSVYIKSLISQKMKVKLVIIDTFEKAEQCTNPLKYFVNLQKIDHWQYSPKESKNKIVETIFE